MTGIAGIIPAERDAIRGGLTVTHPRTAGMALVMTVVLVAPLSSASAHRYHGGPFFWPFAAAAAVVGGAVEIATAPFAAIAAPPAYYYPSPRSYYPSPAYYAPPPGYYAPGSYGR